MKRKTLLVALAAALLLPAVALAQFPGPSNPKSGYLGWEMDYYVNWRLTSDWSWTTRFGTFFPGRAFSDQTTRTFLLVAVTYSF